MPSLKRKSSQDELDLDALFSDLDSAVNMPFSSRNTRLHSPKTPTSSRTRTRAIQPNPGNPESRGRRDKDITQLNYDADNALDNKPCLQTPCISSASKIKRSTPRHKVPLPGSQVADLAALVDGVVWADMDYELTPSPTLQRRSKNIGSSLSFHTPTRALKSHTPLLRSSLKRLRPSESIDLDVLCDGINWSDGWEPSDDESLSNPSNQPSPFREYAAEKCTRCVILKVTEVEIDHRIEKHLDVRDERGNTRRKAVLKGDWATTDVRCGDIVNLIGNFTSSESDQMPTIVLTSSQNILILHPDILIPATAISDASICTRKPLISILVRSGNETTPATVWGNMLHEIMQSCLASGNWGPSFLEERIEHVVRAGLERLVRIDVGIEEARAELRTRAQGLAKFSQKFIRDVPRHDAYLTDSRSTSTIRARLALTDLFDVEENIWSPTYGLKGVVDASMQAHIVEEDGLKLTKHSLTLPLEIKTGRREGSAAHRAQTMLYTLLMSERYGVEVSSGLLYYTQFEEITRVPASRNELRGLILGRNELASYMIQRWGTPDASQKVGMAPGSTFGGMARDAAASSATPRPFLPPTIDDDWACSRCYNVDACMVYRKAVDGVEDRSSPIADLYERKTSHLTVHHAEFFKHWESLIALEEQDMNRFRKELWTMTASAREKTGRCFADMVIVHHTALPEHKTDYSNSNRRHVYTFERFSSSAMADKSKGKSLLSGYITKGDAVAISVEPDLLALCRGFIVELEPTRVIIALDRELTSKVTTRNQTADSLKPETKKNILFRIDKDELSTGLGRIRDNLAQLFYVKGDVKRLSLIVDLEAPYFDEALAPAEDELPVHLNVSQKAAMRKVLAARDYALILGMPGTGKTTTIAEIIKTLVAKGKTVLLASYTHSAVDTILMKLLETDIDVLRLGPTDKVFPGVQQYTLGAKPPATSIQQLEKRLLTPPVVATTCLSIDHALFSRRKFDVCIVDEASQITLPTCIGPLRFADMFVLVGDHHQLPPLVRSRDAKKKGLEVSLFRLLCDTHPQAVVDLAYQYRMNEDIMLISNTLIYKDRLKCGTKAVAERSFVLPNPSALDYIHPAGVSCGGGECWIQRVLHPSCKAVFIDTDPMSAKESRVGDLVQNESEALLIQQLVGALCRSGVEETRFAIISLYRQQNKLLAHLLQAHTDLEIMTADKSQGRDKDCIIISMVRSNNVGNTGDLLKDWRRINVALTRARSKLVVIGSRTTLSVDPLLSRFLSLMSEKRWIVQVPANAATCHGFTTQVHEQNPSLLPSIRSSRPLASSASLSRKGKLDEGILRGRGMLKDVLNDLS